MSEQHIENPRGLMATTEENLYSDAPEIAKTVQFMERVHAAEVFSTPEKSKEFLDSLPYDEFKKLLSTLGGIERNIPRAERQQVSDSFVRSEGMLFGVEVEYWPPHKSHRDGLLKMAFEKAQSLDDPKLAGLTLGLAINAIHYFEDGNGRTARTVFALLTRGYTGSKEDQAYYSSIIENMKGREVLNVNPAKSKIDEKIQTEMFRELLEKKGLWEAYDDQLPNYVYDGYPDVMAGEHAPEELAVCEEIDKVGRNMLFQAMENGRLCIVSLLATFEPERVKDFVRTSPDGARTFVDGNTFLPTLTQEDINKWWNNSESATTAYVKRLINVAERDDVEEVAAAYGIQVNTTS